MICRFVVCIPVFNNPETIASVIAACLKCCDHPILVVDDGSVVPVEQLCQNVSFDSSDSKRFALSRVTYFRHPKNQGKGVALQTGISEAVKLGYTHMISMDGDGQHSPEDLEKLTKAAIENPWALIVGDREMKTENVPESSRFGKKFSNFWVRYQTEANVADSQSGFRVYPLFFVQNLKCFCKNFDFEIEILIRLIWRGIQVKNVCVKVQYFPKAKRVTHFHKIKDNLRLSVLNTCLTIISMLIEKSSPLKSALACSIGVFIGTTPLFGLHTGIILLLAFVLRLNVVYMWIGSNISIPPMIPLLVLGSKYLGEAALGVSNTSLLQNGGEQPLIVETPDLLSPRTLEHLPNLGMTWIVGSLILGLILALATFLLVYYTKALFFNDKNQKTWNKQRPNKPGIWFVRFLLDTFGLRLAYFFLYFIVSYYFLFSRQTRRALNEYWRTVRPQFGFWQRQINIYKQILTFAQTLVDRGLQNEKQQLFFNYELDPNVNLFIKALDFKSRGMVAIASHIGGWELALTFFAYLPTEKKMLAVMHGPQGQYSHRSGRSKDSKSEVIFYNLHDNTILKVKDFIEAGHLVGMMGDRPVTKSHEMLPFFGKLAVFDTTPFRVALACQAKMYFVFAIKIGQKKYRISTFTPNDGATVQSALQQYIASLEAILMKNPEQWFNFFPFWSEKPFREALLAHSKSNEIG